MRIFRTSQFDDFDINEDDQGQDDAPVADDDYGRMLDEAIGEVNREAEMEEHRTSLREAPKKTIEILRCLLAHAGLPLPEGAEEFARREVIRSGGMNFLQYNHLASRMLIDAILGKPVGNFSLGSITGNKMDFLMDLVRQDILNAPKDLWLADAVYDHITFKHEDANGGTSTQTRNESLYLAQMEYRKARKMGYDVDSWRARR